LGSIADLPLEVIAEEFRARHRFGDRPSADSFRRRFEGHRPELEPLLAQVLAELKQEFQPDTSGRRPPASDVSLDAPVPYQDFIVRQLIGSGRMGKVYR